MVTREHNWADNYTYRAARIHRPTSIDEYAAWFPAAPRCARWGHAIRSTALRICPAIWSTSGTCRPIS